MVKRDTDGSKLFFIGPDGQKVEANVMDKGYNALLETFDLQISAKKQNNHNKDLYCQKVANANVSIDASRNPGPLPEKPKHLTVSDPTIDEFGDITAGVQSEDDNWEPALPKVHKKK